MVVPSRRTRWKKVLAEKRVRAVLLVLGLLSVLVGVILVGSESTERRALGVLGFAVYSLVLCLRHGQWTAAFTAIALTGMGVFASEQYVQPWWYSVLGERLDGCVVVDPDAGLRDRSVYHVRCGEREFESDNDGSWNYVAVYKPFSLRVDRTGLLPPRAVVPWERDVSGGPFALGGFLVFALAFLPAARFAPKPRSRAPRQQEPGGPLTDKFL
ncbi:hypothetical protein [Actinosynnema sp.]|uniref:hypothetical protein n=1 Tax=Actinosynnema sp. TaxID=1872144 RepID=UPI003F82CD91